MKCGATVIIVGLLMLLASCSDDDPVTISSNRAPVMQIQPDTTISAGDTLVLWAVARDPDGDALAYGLTAFVTPAQILAGDVPDTDFEATGRFVFRALASDRPKREFAFKADDGRGGTASTEFAVAVQ